MPARCPVNVRTIRAASRSHTLTAPAALPAHTNSSVGENLTASMAVVWPLRLYKFKRKRWNRKQPYRDDKKKLVFPRLAKRDFFSLSLSLRSFHFFYKPYLHDRIVGKAIQSHRRCNFSPFYTFRHSENCSSLFCFFFCYSVSWSTKGNRVKDDLYLLLLLWCKARWNCEGVQGLVIG